MYFDRLLLKATAPYRNGCSWRLVLAGADSATARHRIEFGCYLGPFSMDLEAGDLLKELTSRADWDGSGCAVRVPYETLRSMMRRECPLCRAPFHKIPTRSSKDS